MARERTRTDGSELVSASRSFGEALRRQRERRGIALKTIAEQTKIGSSFLASLERGDCAKWPGGIYSRAWIRAYATAIGLDPDEVGRQFNRCFASNAFLESETDAKAIAPDELPRITPLRMTLDPDPRERTRLTMRRVFLFFADLAVAGAAAVVLSLLTAVSFSLAFGGAVILCHAIGLIGGGGSAVGWMERTLRRHARPQDEDAESAVAEAA
jgi:transcriptional regulator with XRE-family HTH domain